MRFRTRVSNYGGVYPIPLYTKPAKCGGDCVYCPRIPGIPTSYIVNEDTRFARAVGYEPSPQFDRFSSRIRSSQGHGIPLEIILLGGSYSALDESYRRTYMSDLYLHLEELHAKRRASFLCSIVSAESRPDQITQDECDLLRELGVSKIEIGVQHVEDHILQRVNRAHRLKDVMLATELLKQNGFKVGYHVMLGLPGAQHEDDVNMLTMGLWGPELSPDFLKIYPCELLRNRNCQPRLWDLYEAGSWQPPNTNYIQRVLAESCGSIPGTVRISRIMRQFRQSDVWLPRLNGLHTYLSRACKCIRCREAGKVGVPSEGIEFAKCNIEEHWTMRDACIQVLFRGILVALARLYRRNDSCIILRELHVYGPARHLGTAGVVQGNRIGSCLLEYVEGIAERAGQERILVNAAVGARGFFVKRGYHTNDDGYLEKIVCTWNRRRAEMEALVTPAGVGL